MNKIEIIEDVLREWYENDDSYVVNGIVNTIRKKLKDDNFAKGASFRDEGIYK